jgi:hypothetical protein
MITGYEDLPRPIRSGLVLVDPRLGIPKRVIVMQFNPDTLSRTLTPQTTTGESGDRSEALRLTAPAIETWQFDAQPRFPSRPAAIYSVSRAEAPVPTLRPAGWVLYKRVCCTNRGKSLR